MQGIKSNWGAAGCGFTFGRGGGDQERRGRLISVKEKGRGDQKEGAPSVSVFLHGSGSRGNRDRQGEGNFVGTKGKGGGELVWALGSLARDVEGW